MRPNVPGRFCRISFKVEPRSHAYSYLEIIIQVWKEKRPHTHSLRQSLENPFTRSTCFFFRAIHFLLFVILAIFSFLRTWPCKCPVRHITMFSPHLTLTLEPRDPPRDITTYEEITQLPFYDVWQNERTMRDPNAYECVTGKKFSMSFYHRSWNFDISPVVLCLNENDLIP